MTKKELVVTEEQTAMMALYEGAKETGFEEANQDAYSLPFIALLQGLSPQITRGKAEFISGAASGQFCNTATGELYGDNVYIIPVYWQQVFIEWRTRENGGGFIAEYNVAAGSKMMATTSKGGPHGYDDILPNDNELIDTRKHFVLVVNQETGMVDPALITLTKTQIKHSKKLMTRLHSLALVLPNGKVIKPAPMYSHVITVSSAVETKDQNSWNVWSFGDATPVTDNDHVVAALEYLKLIRAGETNIKYDEMKGSVDDDNQEAF